MYAEFTFPWPTEGEQTTKAVQRPSEVRQQTGEWISLLHHKSEAHYLVVLEGGVLVDPVRVKYAHVSELRAHALLSHRPQVAHRLDLVDTVVLGLT